MKEQLVKIVADLKSVGYVKVDIQPGKLAGSLDIALEPGKLLDAAKNFAALPVLQAAGIVSSVVHLFNDTLFVRNVKQATGDRGQETADPHALARPPVSQELRSKAAKHFAEAHR